MLYSFRASHSLCFGRKVEEKYAHKSTTYTSESYHGCMHHSDLCGSDGEKDVFSYQSDGKPQPRDLTESRHTCTILVRFSD